MSIGNLALRASSATEWIEAPESDAAVAISVVIPAYNEAGMVGAQIESVRDVMDGAGYPYELIVVDDGSQDETGNIVRQHDAILVSKKYNRGYGAALKTGIAAAKYDWILIIDADGTYPVESIPQLVAGASRLSTWWWPPAPARRAHSADSTSDEVGLGHGWRTTWPGIPSPT